MAVSLTDVAKEKTGTELIAQNRRARHDYEISDTFECGMVLRGVEVKSLREGKANLRESYARIDDNELWVFQLNISPWKSASNWDAVNPDRKRKLLVHNHELDEMRHKTERDSFTLVPLSLYFKNGRAKLELAIARGRKKYDKRAAIAKRDSDREVQRQLSNARKHTAG